MIENPRIGRRDFLVGAAAAYAALNGLGSAPEVRAEEEPQIRPLEVIYIHGISGGGTELTRKDDTFVDELKDTIQQQKLTATFPSCPNSTDPNAEEWVQTIRNRMEKATQEGRDIILVGYSLGTRATLLALRSYLTPGTGYNPAMLEKVKGLLLLAPLDDNPELNRYRHGSERESHYPSFFQDRIGDGMLQAITNSIPHTTILHEEGDTVVAPFQGAALARRMRANQPDSHVSFRVLTTPQSNHFSSHISGKEAALELHNLVSPYLQQAA